MVDLREYRMGRFMVYVEVANYDDMVRTEIGDLAADRVRRVSVRGVVDSGATRLVLPESVVRQLGLKPGSTIGVRYADGRREERPSVMGVHLTYGGRSSVFSAVVEPGRESALIGAIVLEELDLIPDCTTQTLTPRDPRQIVSEIE